MKVRVYVTPKEGILDPQGATVERVLPALGFSGVSGVRIGKFIELNLDPAPGVSSDQARAQVDEMCRKLLANPIIEDFSFAIDDAQ
ncbi:MAG: phosphoribosylformylglycinamidine synthase subunit PurS [Thermoleophilia bacterium]